ncbi:MAG TPA: mucoidy inhibitor MuiA family protein, partial [Chitinophagaceae bacterium]|nr:mucoidy inhibitor MuiA family protein [Chitinophagaceae bacterium]
MHVKSVLMLAACFASFQVFAGDDKITVTAPLNAATVYRAGAELSHTATLTLKKGNNDIVLEGMSNGLDINSVQVGCNHALTILSMAFSTDYLASTSKSALVEKLEDSVSLLVKENDKLQVLIKTNLDLLEALKANREIRGAQTGVSVTELMKMMDYYKSKTLELQNEMALYHEKQAKLSDRLQQLKNQINEEAQKNNKTVGRLLLQVVTAAAGNYELAVSYMTPRASWNPSYELRVENVNKPMTLLYKARMSQTTGLDWKQVKLTLSTSLPSQNSNAPVLKSWFLAYQYPVSYLYNQLPANSLPSMVEGRAAGVAVNNLSEVVVVGYSKKEKEEEDASELRVRGTNSVKNASPVYVVDGKVVTEQKARQIDGARVKSVNVLKGAAATALYGTSAANGAIVLTLKDQLGDYVTVNDNQLNITYDIELPYDVPGNGKEQNVSLKELAVNTYYNYYAVPTLDKDAYLLAELANWEKLNLLPGEANIIFEGR